MVHEEKAYKMKRICWFLKEKPQMDGASLEQLEFIAQWILFFPILLI